MRFYKIALLKAWFEKGYSLTSYIKWIVALFGLYQIITTKSFYFTLMLMIIYGVCCFIIGWGWYKFGFIDAEIEVQNHYNLFVKQMRKRVPDRKV